MSNISNELRGLFKEYMVNKNKPVIPSTTASGNREGILFSTSVKVHFYEWSNVTSVPRTFYSISAFDTYLKGCGIYTQLYERDIIVNLGECFVSCYRGKKQLCIRATYKHLLETMNEHDRLQTAIDQHKLQEIKNGSKAPMCINEGGYDGPWYG